MAIGKPAPSLVLPADLRLVAWEVTRRCNLACGHCRASALCGPYPGELGTERGLRLLDEIAELGRPVVILTGGEPLLREDLHALARHGDSRGLRMVLATNGTLLTEATAISLGEAGIRRVSVSLDGPDAASHDAFRGVPGAFAGALAGIEAMARAGLEYQINTTITRANLAQIGEIHALAHRLRAAAHHIFLLVPTGRGREMADQAISALAYEETLHWFHDEGLSCGIQLKATCAPHYYRILRQRKGEGGGVAVPGPVAVPAGGKGPAGPGGGASPSHPLHAATRGCLGGSAFAFISHTGQVQPCGYLELDCGQAAEDHFAAIWRDSPIFRELRDLRGYKGKCGRCEFLRVCGGCRARAYEATGDYLAEEPLCIYEPARQGGKTTTGEKKE